jgi:predicted lipoprotein with Yx(FWY)xxD motif
MLEIAEHSVSARGRARVLRALQIALGVFWLLDSALQLQPHMFHKSFVTHVIEPNRAGQPGIVAQPIAWASNLITPRIVVFTALAATLQALVGLGLLYRPTVKPALLVSFAWVLGVWWLGEGFGMLLTGKASALTGAPGAVLLYGIVGMIVWPDDSGRMRVRRRRAGSGGSSYAADRADAGYGGLLGPWGVRGAWAALWLLAAALWLMPANRDADATRRAIAKAPSGTHWLSSLQHSAASATVGHGATIAIAIAAISCAIASAVLIDWHARPFLLLSCLISLVYWIFGQGLGGLFTGSATNLGAGPLFLLLAAAMYLLLEPPVHRSSSQSGKDPASLGSRWVIAGIDGGQTPTNGGTMKASHISRPLLVAAVTVFAAFAALGVDSLAVASSSNAPHATASASTATVSARHTSLGTILVGAGGRTLYLFEADKKGHSACTGSCAKAWPPLMTSGKPKASGSVKASLLGEISRPGGKQVTYAGHPLYYFIDDSKAGQTNGEGSDAFGAEWDVVSTSGKGIDKG